MRCAQCNTDNGDDHRFCFQCGASLVAHTPTPPSSDAASGIGEGERRQLTMLFCDMVESTPLAVQYDPEELREIIRQFQDTLIAAVERYDGFVAQHRGDELVVYFGYPRAHEDDAERAVHAGLAMVEAIEALRPRPDLQLQVRVGIATGKIVIADLLSAGAMPEKSAIGQTPALAARLQAVARPNSVVISPHTYHLLGQRFECRDLGVRTLKGIPEPVRVREVIRSTAGMSRFSANQGASVLPLVGRTDEMNLLRDRMKLAVDGNSQTVLLRGDPGIGKSRLARALTDYISGYPDLLTIEIQCSPYHNQNALFPVVEWLREEVFVSHGAVTPEEQWSLILRLLDRSEVDRTQAATLLALLMSVPLPANLPPLNLTPERQKQLTLLLIVEFFRQLTPAVMLFFVVEDVHWADPSTLELIRVGMTEVTRERTFLLLTGRPEFDPSWPQDDHFTTINVGRLEDTQALELVSLAAGGEKLSDDVTHLLIRKTDNVPLYLEVLTKHLILNKAQRDQPDSATGRPGPDDEIPATLQDALMSRLDRMGETKAVAQVAAVLGRDFDRQILESVWTGEPDTLRRGLDELHAADLLQARGERAKGQYQFKHALIRDAAYESLLKRHAETLHRRVAEVLEQQFTDIATRQPAVLAYHFTAGKQFSQALNYWLAAGQKALTNNANPEAVAHLSRGLTVLNELPATPKRDVLELNFRILLGHCLMTWKGYAAEEVRVTCARAHELCALVGNAPQLPIALYQLIAYSIVSARLETALELSKQFLNIANQSGVDDLIVESNLTVGVTYFHLGELGQARTYLEKCVQSYIPEKHGGHAFQFGHDPAVVARCFLIWIYWLTGEQNLALRTSDQAIALARRVNHPLSMAFALAFTGWHRMFCREHDEAVALGKEIIEFCGLQTILIFLAHGHMLVAWEACESNNFEAGMPGMASALDIFRMTGAQHFAPYWEAHQAMMAFRSGSTDGAAAVLDRCLEQVNSTGERWCEAELHRYRGLLLEKTGKPRAEVEASYRLAIDIAQRQGAVTWELRAKISLARFLNVADTAATGDPLLDSLRDLRNLDIDPASAAQIMFILEQQGQATGPAASH